MKGREKKKEYWSRDCFYDSDYSARSGYKLKKEKWQTSHPANNIKVKKSEVPLGWNILKLVY